VLSTSACVRERQTHSHILTNTNILSFSLSLSLSKSFSLSPSLYTYLSRLYIYSLSEWVWGRESVCLCVGATNLVGDLLWGRDWRRETRSNSQSVYILLRWRPRISWDRLTSVVKKCLLLNCYFLLLTFWKLFKASEKKSFSIEVNLIGKW
jgi:hypothetical protein